MSFALVGPAFDGVEEHAEDAEAVVTPASPLPGRLRRGEEAIGSSIPGPSCRRGWCRPRSPISRTPENRDFKSWFLCVSFSRALYFAYSSSSLISANLVNLFYNCSYFLRLKCIRYCFSSLKLLLRKLLLYCCSGHIAACGYFTIVVVASSVITACNYSSISNCFKGKDLFADSNTVCG